MSKQDLASYTGTTYETLFRIMNEMAEEGSISVDGKKISLLNIELLFYYIKDQ
ncbi:helix-turn-helix domain-containing protein [Escherichia coli]|uniref:helix-turn-helix domain-containing protein n=1 Tax=Escherichia coli TaxID=562 RepID=UPI0034D6822F